jgi:hypothetical protein
MLSKKLCWNEFKEILANEQDKNWIYRGHASAEWSLQTTLYRFLEENAPDKIRNEFLASQYHQAISSILKHIDVKSNVDFDNIKPLETNPFKIGLLVANDEHRNDFENEFSMMINLRNLNFPSPLLDWTKNYQVATFFACEKENDENSIAIWRAKITESSFSPFGMKVYSSEFVTKIPNSRASLQEAVYVLLMRQEHADTVVDPSKSVGPIYSLSGLEYETYENVVLEKYVIIDSANKKQEILEELRSANIYFETIYKETHVLENTLLKDLAIKEFVN